MTFLRTSKHEQTHSGTLRHTQTHSGTHTQTHTVTRKQTYKNGDTKHQEEERRVEKHSNKQFPKLLLLLLLPASFTNCRHTMPPHTATTHCHHTLPPHAATTRCIIHRIQPHRNCTIFFHRWFVFISLLCNNINYCPTISLPFNVFINEVFNFSSSPASKSNKFLEFYILLRLFYF